MKIACIGKFEKMHDEEGKARSLEKLGHEVIRFDENLNFRAEFVFREKPDMILYAKLKVPLEEGEFLVSMARAKGIKAVCWVPDLYWGLPREMYIGRRQTIWRSSIVFSPDGGNQDRFAQAGVVHKVLRQGIYDEECYIGKEKGPEYDVVFVGSENIHYPYRTKLIKFLKETYGDRFHWFGEFNSDQVRGDDLNKLYGSAKVIVGDSVWAPYYWSNRIYETIGRAGFIIHPDVPGLEKDYTPYKHFVPYTHNDFAGLKEKIDHYLTHPEDRDAIRFAGYEHTKKNHTLINRCEELCTTAFI